MSKKPPRSKLSLKKRTIAVLGTDALKAVVGGDESDDCGGYDGRPPSPSEDCPRLSDDCDCTGNKCFTGMTGRNHNQALRRRGDD